MMPNQQGPQQGPQPTQAQLRAAVQQQQQQIQQHQFQQQQLQQQQLQQQQQQSVSQQSSQSPQQQQQQPSAIYLTPQQIMLQPNAQTFSAMPNGSNFIQMTPFTKKPMLLPSDSKGPRGKMLISPAGPQLQSISSFVAGQSPQPLGNQYYTLQTFPSQGGPVQNVNSATLLSPNNHQYLFTVSPNTFQNQPFVLNQNSVPIPVGNNGQVISLAPQSHNVRTATKTTASVQNNGQPCLIAPATQMATQRLKSIKPAIDNRASIGTQTATATGQIMPGQGTPITIPIQLQHQQINQQQHIQLQLQPQLQTQLLQTQPQAQSHPPTKSPKVIQSTNISNKDRSSNLDTLTTVTLVPQRNTIGNTTTNSTNVNNMTKTTAKSNKLIASNVPLKEKVIQSPKKKATTTGTDTVDLVEHCSDSNNLTNGVNKSNGSKSPQRAIVKPYINDPNVLTHVIDGFVIQESPSPFAVNIDGLEIASEETIIDPIDERENKEDSIMLDTSDSNNVCTETPTIKTKSSKGDASCETCKKSINKYTKKKKLKRFCNTICAKKSNNNNSDKPVSDNNGEIIESTKQQSSQPASKKLKTDGSPSCKVTESTEPLDSSIDGGYIPAGGSNPNLWNVQDVYDFVRHLPGCQEYADEFKSQEIDGQALMLLKEDHLMSAMNMKLGPALKICSRITSLFKAEANKSQA